VLNSLFVSFGAVSINWPESNYKTSESLKFSMQMFFYLLVDKYI